MLVSLYRNKFEVGVLYKRYLGDMVKAKSMWYNDSPSLKVA